MSRGPITSRAPNPVSTSLLARLEPIMSASPENPASPSPGFAVAVIATGVPLLVSLVLAVYLNFGGRS